MLKLNVFHLILFVVVPIQSLSIVHRRSVTDLKIDHFTESSIALVNANKSNDKIIEQNSLEIEKRRNGKDTNANGNDNTERISNELIENIVRTLNSTNGNSKQKSMIVIGDETPSNDYENNAKNIYQKPAFVDRLNELMQSTNSDVYILRRKKSNENNDELWKVLSLPSFNRQSKALSFEPIKRLFVDLLPEKWTRGDRQPETQIVEIQSNDPKFPLRIWAIGSVAKFPPFVEHFVQRIQSYYSIYKYEDLSRPIHIRQTTVRSTTNADETTSSTDKFKLSTVDLADVTKSTIAETTFIPDLPKLDDEIDNASTEMTTDIMTTEKN